MGIVWPPAVDAWPPGPQSPLVSKGTEPQPGEPMKRLLLLALLFVLGGCTTTQYVTSGEMAGIAPALSVERFLRASNARDLHGMARIFGTEKGPIIETGGAVGCAFKKMGSWLGMGRRCTTLQEVELRMDAIAEVLRHDDYNLVSESRVPGRVNPTTRIGVDVSFRGRTARDVPFVVVRTKDGRWFIEQIGLDKITGPGL